jgi:hypothetical protein
VKVVKSQKKLCSQYELCFLDIFPQFEVFKTTIFEETLPDFIKEENTHVQLGDGKSDFASFKTMSRHLTNALVWILHW